MKINIKNQVRKVLQDHSYLNFLGHEIININDDVESIIEDINNMVNKKLAKLDQTKGKNNE